MILKVFSAFDAKLAVFDAPFYMLTDAAAIRAFSDQVNDSSGQSCLAKWNRHPEDYSLFRIGEFNDQTGEIVCSKPVSLVTASAIFSMDSAQLDLFDKNGLKREPARK